MHALTRFVILSAACSASRPAPVAPHAPTTGPPALAHHASEPGDNKDEPFEFGDSGRVSGCRGVQVRVVDEDGRPIADAEVGLYVDEGGGSRSGTAGTTRTTGVVCAPLQVGNELTVTAPFTAGGSCAGYMARTVVDTDLTAPPTITLRMREFVPHVLRGRIVDDDGDPVPAARITVASIAPAGAGNCTGGGGLDAKSTADGTFALPPLPVGTVRLVVRHDDHATREITITNGAPPHDIALAKGQQWRGRVLDPAGKPIDRCDIALTVHDRTKTSACSASGFSFSGLTPGDVLTATVVLHHNERLVYRTLAKKITVPATKAPHLEDVQFPRGDDIIGRVVDSKGAAVSGARILAVPKGVDAFSTKRHPDEVTLEADAQGRFAFRDLRSGPWTLRVGNITSLDVATGTKNVNLVAR